MNFNNVKAACKEKNVDICCWKLFTFLFFIFRDTGYILFELCYSLDVIERMLIKGKMGIQRKRLYKFFS